MPYLFFLFPLLLFGQDQNSHAEAIEQAIVVFEHAFKNSDATNIFKPIFLLANKQEVQMPNFKIMQ